MPHLTIFTENKNGGPFAAKKNLGFARIDLRHDGDRITADDYQGSGNDYKQREQTEIIIQQNYEIIFCGTKHELFELIKNAQK